MYKEQPSTVRYFFSENRSQSEGREALCLPNLLAGGLPASALPGLALATDKRAQHTRATQKSTTHARHTKRDAWIYKGDITAAIEMRGRRAAPAPLSLLSYQAPVYIPCVCVVLFCVARVCCALLCGARVLCSFVSCTCKRQTGQRTCRQAPSQEIRQA